MKKYDISLMFYPGMVTWPGHLPFQMQPFHSLDAGDHNNISTLNLDTHTGTHIDAPYHFIKGGHTVESLSLDTLVGPAQVIHLADPVELITAEVLQNAGIKPGIRRLLIRTRNSKYWMGPEADHFQPDFVGFSPEGAQHLVDLEINLVGVDYLSVAPYRKGRLTHEILLSNGIIVVEGLNLWEVPAGYYDLCCLPLKLAGADGAPARAILLAV